MNPLLIMGGVGLVSFFVAKAAGAKTAPPVLPPGTAPPPVVVVPTPGSVATTAKKPPQPVMPEKLQRLMASALRGLRVNDKGVVVPPVPLDQIQAATQISGILEREGFPAAAKELRRLAIEASNKSIQPPTKNEDFPLPPSLSEDMKARIRRMIRSERDPDKLQGLIDALKKLPRSPEGDLAIQTLTALILQIELENIKRESLDKADDVIKKPTGSLEPKPKPTPIEVVPPKKPPVVVPPPQPPIPPKTPKQQAGEAMAIHLKAVQSRFGMPGAKGKEDQSIVRKFQRLGGISQDGKAGPGTLSHAASFGQFDLPLVMYWPRNSNRRIVQKYRDSLRKMADQADERGLTTGANQLRIVANSERGQGGIANFGPALV